MRIQDTKWYNERPPLIQQRIDEYPPQYLYRNRKNNQIVQLYSYDEGHDGSCKTCTVSVLQKNNPHIILVMERNVFGVPLDDLERLDILREI